MQNKFGTFVFSRSKMGFEISCYEHTGVYSLLHNGQLLHQTTDDMRRHGVEYEAAFFTAWQKASGFIPFSVLRRVGKNKKFRRVGTAFIPGNTTLVRVVADWNRVRAIWK